MQIPKVLDPVGNLDGLEVSPRPSQGFLISDFVKGVVYQTGKSNKPVKTLLDNLKGSADIGVIAKKKVLLVPEMSASKVSGYQL